MLAEKSFQLEAHVKTSKWKFVRNAIPSTPGYSGLSMSADGLIGLKRNMGCKQRPAVVAGGEGVEVAALGAVEAAVDVLEVRRFPAHGGAAIDELEGDVAGIVIDDGHERGVG